MQKELSDTIKSKSESNSWTERLEALSEIEKIGIPIDDKQEEGIVTILAHLSDDPKWEVRRAVVSILANFRYIKVKEIIDKLTDDSNKWVKEIAERTKRKLKISASTDKRDRKYDYALSLIRKLKRKYPEQLSDEILDDILNSVLDVGEKYYEELASDATHQINTALTGLHHSTEELQAKLPKSGKSKKEIGKLFSSLLEQKEYLEKIVKDLRIYSEPYDTNFALEKIEPILEEALSRAKNNVCPPAKNRSFKEIIKIDPTLAIDVHKEGLINAFTNIICNALDAMPNGGTLEIMATSTRPEFISVVISDTGSGMTIKQIEDAKKRWSTSKKGRIGLGLPIALKIIERGHKGKVTIESKKGEWTKVSVELPIQKEEASL